MNEATVRGSHSHYQHGWTGMSRNGPFLTWNELRMDCIELSDSPPEGLVPEVDRGA